MRFPRVHIATSVVNRIMNMDETLAVTPTTPPEMPNVSQQGQDIDKALSTPVAPLDAPEGVEMDVVNANMSGESAADAVKSAGIVDALDGTG